MTEKLESTAGPLSPPWRTSLVSGNGRTSIWTDNGSSTTAEIAYVFGDGHHERAEQIVKCCNGYPKAIGVLEELEDVLKTFKPEHLGFEDAGDGSACWPLLPRLLTEIRAVLSDLGEGK